MRVIVENFIASNASLIEAISKKCEEIRKRELNKAAKKMAAKSGTEDYIKIEQLTLFLVDALLKIPLQNLKMELQIYKNDSGIKSLIENIFRYS